MSLVNTISVSLGKKDVYIGRRTNTFQSRGFFPSLSPPYFPLSPVRGDPHAAEKEKNYTRKNADTGDT
ncbi:hypothetical protein GWI33_018453 [Rhynchophorus ferrugineus]|uniref:Uncharacterized protein n=1 Tax=Rhynchophorus ferrugineus TaxID=354439 RepID=A0A834HWC3_RHYFE|nr:hypothetical protein GWI33_018453 [Rhynchophorus ferrugineus]